MSDGITINPSTGVSEAVSVAFDDAGSSGKVQVVKLAISADGSAVVLPSDATYGLDVDVTRLPGTVADDLTTVAGKDFATQTTLAGIATALAHGTYAYAAGTAATTVDIPSGARARRVTVRAGGIPATVTIAGGATITVLAGDAFDEQIPGDATLGGDVVIGGGVTSYYVAWTT